jgi:DNA polymerase III delta prime subunit
MMSQASYRFHPKEFLERMQNKIVQQETALKQISAALQQRQSQFLQHQGPFCSFIFAGPPHCGKKTLARALAQELSQESLLYQLDCRNQISLSESMVYQAEQRQIYPFLQIAQQQAPALFLFTHLEQAAPSLQYELDFLLRTGFVLDQEKTAYDLAQACVIVQLDLDLKKFPALAQLLTLEKQRGIIELAELLKAPYQESKHQGYTVEELIKEYRLAAAQHFCFKLPAHFTLIPFVPPSTETLEKIIEGKLNHFIQALAKHYVRSITYAKEIITYLAQQSALHAQSPEHLLRQLYFQIENTLAEQHTAHKHQDLFLQLDERGKMLRCDWRNKQEISSI